MESTHTVVTDVCMFCCSLLKVKLLYRIRGMGTFREITVEIVRLPSENESTLKGKNSLSVDTLLEGVGCGWGRYSFKTYLLIFSHLKMCLL